MRLIHISAAYFLRPYICTGIMCAWSFLDYWPSLCINVQLLSPLGWRTMSRVSSVLQILWTYRAEILTVVVSPSTHSWSQLRTCFFVGLMLGQRDTRCEFGLFVCWAPFWERQPYSSDMNVSPFVGPWRFVWLLVLLILPSFTFLLGCLISILPAFRISGYVLLLCFPLILLLLLDRWSSVRVS